MGDHILTLVLWAFLTLLGVAIQRCVIRRRNAGIEAARKAHQQKREAAEAEGQRRRQEHKESNKRQQEEAKQENGNKPASPSKSKWPFGGKKDNKVSQLEEGFLEKGKG